MVLIGTWGCVVTEEGRGTRRAVGWVLGGLVLVMVVLTGWEWGSLSSGYAGLQGATAQRLVELHAADPDRIDALIVDAGRDLRSTVWYSMAALAVAVLVLWWRGRLRARSMLVIGGFVVAGALADVAETVLFRRSLQMLSAGDGGGGGDDIDLAQLGSMMHDARWFGIAKWTMLVVALVVLVWFARRPERVAPTAGSVDPRRDPPPAGAERLGVCFSGGGIRSASFSLGVLQRLEEVGWLKQARYLAAVSGGGYLAAGYAVARAGQPMGTPPDQPVWAPGSPEERSFRNNSSYLVPSFLRGVGGVAQLVAGLLWNLLLIWLLLFAVARPVGWLISVAHPELRTTEPVVTTPDPVAEVNLSVRPVPVPGGAPQGATQRAQWYEVRVDRATDACTEDNSARVEVPPFSSLSGLQVWGRQEDELYLGAVARQSGLVRVDAAGATVVRQPEIEIGAVWNPTRSCRPAIAVWPSDSPVRRVLDTVAIIQPLAITLPSAVYVTAADVKGALEVTQPVIRPEVGLRGREDITISPGQLWAGLAPLVVGALLSLGLVLARGTGAVRRWLKRASSTLAVVGAAVFAVLVGLPWLLQEVPEAMERWLGGLPLLTSNPSGLGSGLNDYLVPAGGVFALIVGVVRTFRRSNQSTAPQAGSVAETGRKWFGRLSKSKEQLGWYELSPAKIIAGIILVVVPVLLFFSLLQFATANGPNGTLSGVAVVRDALGVRWLHPPDWVRWGVALVVLAVSAVAFDAHAWSLYPFYKRRLSNAYLLRRTPDGGAEPFPYESFPVPYALLNDAERPEGTVVMAETKVAGPQLITCCAVNLSRPGVVPPARRASSFTFSSNEIGGPLVGYRRAEDFWAALPERRQRDITVPSAMAISGAAFSPAMGKANLGPVGSILAVANLRLGVWLPNPAQVVPPEGGRTGWRLPSWWRPGWTWWLREVLNRYERDSRYVYVSDGGHWENLGLVELLRRGCTEVICVNAGGDGQNSFSTIGEAIALARQEVGVEITLDPSPLRPPLKPAEGSRPLRREPGRSADTPLAAASFVRGTLRYPGGRIGTIWLIEPALTADIPFDVHAWAERSAVFPDDSTADQIFNHQQFEAFRALGYHQASKLAPKLA